MQQDMSSNAVSALQIETSDGRLVSSLGISMMRAGVHVLLLSFNLGGCIQFTSVPNVEVFHSIRR